MTSERPKEPSHQFPKIPRKVLANAVKVSDNDWENFFHAAETREPLLFEGVQHLASQMAEPEKFIFGARVMYGVLSRLEREGYMFPVVSEDTIEAYTGEFEAFSRELLASFPTRPIRTWADLESHVKEISRTVEFNYPGPDRYKKENPELMKWVSARFPLFDRLEIGRAHV